MTSDVAVFGVARQLGVGCEPGEQFVFCRRSNARRFGAVTAKATGSNAHAQTRTCGVSQNRMSDVVGALAIAIRHEECAEAIGQIEVHQGRVGADRQPRAVAGRALRQGAGGDIEKIGSSGGGGELRCQPRRAVGEHIAL